MNGVVARDQVRREPLAAAALVDIAAGLAAARDFWRPRVRHDPQRRNYAQFFSTPACDAWLIGRSSGHGIAAHDHGGSAGVLVVTEADSSSGAGMWTGESRRGSSNPAATPSCSPPSIHVYSPPLVSMRWFEDEGDELRMRAEQIVTPRGSHDGADHDDSEAIA